MTKIEAPIVLTGRVFVTGLLEDTRPDLALPAKAALKIGDLRVYQRPNGTFNTYVFDGKVTRSQTGWRNFWLGHFLEDELRTSANTDRGRSWRFGELFRVLRQLNGKEVRRGKKSFQLTEMPFSAATAARIVEVAKVNRIMGTGKPVEPPVANDLQKNGKPDAQASGETATQDETAVASTTPEVQPAVTAPAPAVKTTVATTTRAVQGKLF